MALDGTIRLGRRTHATNQRQIDGLMQHEPLTLSRDERPN
jgi:hypothetical protein